MKLYDFAFSPNCRKVRAVAYELGVEFESVRVDLVKGEQRDAEYRKLNPNARVPVLVDDDFVLWESTAIMRYFSAARGEALVPTNGRERADMDRWLAWQLAHLGPAMSKVAFERIVKRLTGQGEADAAVVAKAVDEFQRLTAILESALDGRQYLAGTLSLADFALASHYSLATMCGLDLVPHPRVSTWLEHICALPSMNRALSEANSVVLPHAAE